MMIKSMEIIVFILFLGSCKNELKVSSVTIGTPEPVPIILKLEVINQPLVTQVNQIISPAITVAIRDQNDNILTDYSGSITLSLNTHGIIDGTNLSGTITQNIINGIAEFDDIMINSFAEGVQFNFSVDSYEVDTIEFAIDDLPIIYRSVGVASSEIATSAGTGFTASITSGVITFSGDLPSNIGVGDAIEVDLNDSNTLTGTGDDLYFIHGRISNSEFLVRDSSGAIPPDMATNDTWEVDRAHLNGADAENSVDNPRISTASSYTTTSLASDSTSLHFAFYADGVDNTVVYWNSNISGDSNEYVRAFTPYLKSEVGVSQRHNGSWDTSKFYMLPPVNSLYTMRYWIYHLRIEGIQFEWPSNTTLGRAVIYAENITTNTNLRIKNCIFRDTGGSPGQSAMSLDSRTVNTNQYFRVHNNVVYDFSRSGIKIGDGVGGKGEGQYHIYNNTFVNMDKAVEIVNKDAGIHYARNNIVQNIVTAGFDGTFDSPSDYNISNLGDGPGANSINSSSVQFMGASNFLLMSTDTIAKDSGEDLRLNSFIPFATGIQNDTRGDTWSIGADQ